MIKFLVVFIIIFATVRSFSTITVHLRQCHEMKRTYKQACEEVKKGQICGVAFGLG